MIPTYQDCVNHLLDYLGSDPGDAALRDSKKAVNEAYRDLANVHSWTYLYTPVCLQTSPMVGADPCNPGISDGTSVAYYHASGPVPRMVVLSGPPGGLPPAWPDWAVDGMLVLGHYDSTALNGWPCCSPMDPASTLGDASTASDFPYGANLSFFVERVISPTVLTLRENSNPGCDVPPSPYSFYRDSYPLPWDFIAQDITIIPTSFPHLLPVHPREWMRISQGEVRVGRPIYYSILGYERQPGRHAVHFSPIPDVRYQLNYAYKRMPRAVSVYMQSNGSVSVDADLVTVFALGGATFTPQMAENSIIRFGLPGVPGLPTDVYRENPFYAEGLITQVLDATHAIIDPPVPMAIQGVQYVISDMMDIDPGSMMTVLLRLSEQKLTTIRIMKDRQFPISEYLSALDRAKCADSRSMMGRSPREYLFDHQRDISLWRNR
jgi:hypothetical protein